MRTRIWTELTQAKHNVEFNSIYADVQRTRLRYFNIAILAFSSGGIMGWAIWNNVPFIACCIIATVSLLRLVQPHLIMSERQISNLDSIGNFYSEYYNKLERLWYDSEHQTLNNDKIKGKFFEIKNTELSINSLVNETIRTKPKRLTAKAKSHSDQYFAQTFNTRNHE